MADIFSDALKFAGKMANQALTGDNLKDYKHASKLFVADHFRLMPKYGFLFHVAFDINPNVAPNNVGNPNFKDEIGMMVKSVSLPKFNVDVKKFNAYNRPNFVQTKINYESLNISFHDDSADLIRNFWYDYYSYYYRDSDYSLPAYGMEHKYQPTRVSTKWGYTPRNVATGPYLNAIRIYSLHQKKFSEYILVNPIIRSFKHGEHAQGSNETMTHDMTIDYESVLYYYGNVSKDTVNGFINLHYDQSPSPLTLAGGSKSIFGPGGILESGSDISQDLKDGNYGAAIFKAGRVLNSAKGMNIGKAAIGEILAMGTGMMRDTNPNNPISVPSLFGSSSSSTGSGGFSLSGLVSGIGSSGSSGNNGGGWLAAAAGLGIGSILGGKRSMEVTDASSYDGFPPATPYNELPSPTEQDVLASMNNDTYVMAGETTINNQSDLTVASNQGSVDLQEQKQDIQNNLNVTERQISNAQTKYTQAKVEAEDAAGTYQMFNERYQEALAAGEDPAGFRMRNLARIVDQQQLRASAAADNVTVAQQKLDTLKDQKSNLSNELQGLA